MKKEVNEFENLVEQTKKKEKIKKEAVDFRWIGIILIVSFVISFLLSWIANITIPNLSLLLGILVTLLFIGIGVCFDIIGVAVTTADEAVFHSMNSRKVKGAALAVRFKKKADRVSCFCSDVIGDICGVISGAAGTTIAVTLVRDYHADPLLSTLIITAIISSLTIGGKAVGKSLAVNKGDIILYGFTKILSTFYHS